ncbi:anthranilate phosphoribosyltransferase [Paenibacillus pasadenensis]|uniref:anthranilate phosphoribosyltransferase n=1 Tax=Paenibacillus pasadenensis TaxID=217090 RepID=UPI00203B461F|nr:anthranilate phosphoribosyltransferase [Paenibacillus pasadenensis]MCM3748643.1 anthranilate phosphoribosyltransferase [Paenibacillus pasadenensis]
MIHLLKEVGRGKRGAKDLGYDDAAAAAEAILGGAATPAQIGAFLIAERIKMESVEEIEAFVRVCRTHARRDGLQGGIDFAGPYDGRKRTFIATFPTAFVLAAAGLPVTLHGSAPLPPKWGVTLHSLLEAAGLDPDRLSREALQAAARQTGVLYVPAESWCPALGRLRPIREELGLRTVLNTAEKLLDYGGSPYLAFGVFHNTVFERLARLLTGLGYERSLLIQGAEGSEDLHLNRPTRLYIVENGVAELQVVDPEALGLDLEQEERDWTAAEQLQAGEAVLGGEGSMSHAGAVLLNAALRLQLARRADSLEEGVYIAKELLESGAAWGKYQAWKKSLELPESKALAAR